MERCELYLSEESVQELMRRLSRIEGQVKGIRRMLEEGRSCDEILIQMSAVKSAISSMAMFLLEEHFNSCVKPGVESGNVKALEDFMRAVRQLVKGG
jgi:DNA-binding FrmR family transcriptional regulator